jgi:hypothetical protein
MTYGWQVYFYSSGMIALSGLLRIVYLLIKPCLKWAYRRYRKLTYFRRERRRLRRAYLFALLGLYRAEVRKVKAMEIAL